MTGRLPRSEVHGGRKLVDHMRPRCPHPDAADNRRTTKPLRSMVSARPPACSSGGSCAGRNIPSKTCVPRGSCRPFVRGRNVPLIERLGRAFIATAPTASKTRQSASRASFASTANAPAPARRFRPLTTSSGRSCSSPSRQVSPRARAIGSSRARSIAPRPASHDRPNASAGMRSSSMRGATPIFPPWQSRSSMTTSRPSSAGRTAPLESGPRSVPSRGTCMTSTPPLTGEADAVPTGSPKTGPLCE